MFFFNVRVDCNVHIAQKRDFSSLFDYAVWCYLAHRDFSRGRDIRFHSCVESNEIALLEQRMLAALTEKFGQEIWNQFMKNTREFVKCILIEDGNSHDYFVEMSDRFIFFGTVED